MFLLLKQESEEQNSPSDNEDEAPQETEKPVDEEEQEPSEPEEEPQPTAESVEETEPVPLATTGDLLVSSISSNSLPISSHPPR